MLDEKLERKILRRVDNLETKERWYSPSDNLEDLKFSYPSVTHILNVAVPQKLKEYFVKNSANKQAKRLEETADLGTAIHNAIESDLKGETPTIAPEISAAFEKWKEVKEKYRIKSIMTEAQIYSDSWGYAGTFDIYGEFDGKLCLMDIKTGWMNVKHGWQLVAYHDAGVEMGLWPDGIGLVVIQIKRDGSIGQPFVYEHKDWLRKSFHSAFQIWKSFNFTRLNKMEWHWLQKTPLSVNL